MIGPLSDQATTSITCTIPLSSSDEEDSFTLMSLSFIVTTINIAVCVLNFLYNYKHKGRIIGNNSKE